MGSVAGGVGDAGTIHVSFDAETRPAVLAHGWFYKGTVGQPRKLVDVQIGSIVLQLRCEDAVELFGKLGSAVVSACESQVRALGEVPASVTAKEAVPACDCGVCVPEIVAGSRS